MAIKTCALLPTALLEWRTGPPAKNWQDLKQHCSEAYQTLLRSGTHEKICRGASNAQTLPYQIHDADNDKETITMLTNALSTVAMAHNANTQAVREDVLALKAEIASLQNMIPSGGSSIPSNATASRRMQTQPLPLQQYNQAPPVACVMAPQPPP